MSVDLQEPTARQAVPSEFLEAAETFLAFLRAGDWDNAVRAFDEYRGFMANMMHEWEYTEVVRLCTCDYRLYLRTEHWARVREATLAQSAGRCAVCNSDQQIDVHHRTYERRGWESPGDTIALCHECHELFHKNGKLAQ